MSCGADRGADGRLRQLWRIGPFAAALHVRELIAQGCDRALGEEPLAIDVMNGCFMPAPAPWASTSKARRHRVVLCGAGRRTLLASPTANDSCSASGDSA